MPSDAPSALDPESFLNFGDLLRYLRRRARVSQRDLSIAVGYNFAHISRLEQGQRLPDPAVIAAVFVPALGLAEEPVWAQRLIALAEAARRNHQVAETQPESTTNSLPSLSPVASQVPEVPPLLATKLYVPRPRTDLVPRPRLMAELDRALEVPLTLITAPAGFGKTTLVTTWLHQKDADKSKKDAQRQERVHPSSFDPLPLQVAWIALDDGDNQPTIFLRYLIAALQTIAPTVGGEVLAMVQSAQPPSIDVITRALLNDLAALPHETVLVLDDYHLITTPAIHTAITFLLEHLPPTFHLLIATRSDPPLPLARLRARGQLVEVRVADVRFTSGEAAAFLTETMRLPLSSDDIAALETRTEGWVAGLQLAALAMRNRSDLSSFISTFTGSNRFVVDYLATEVFARQPSHLQTFLLQTSILNRLCGSLCDAVMGLDVHTSPSHAAYSQALLEELERTNLFLVPLDDERRWYRYHHLFSAMLRERLLQGVPTAEVERLHQRATAWFVAQELIDEALHHALAAGDSAGAAALVERRAADTLKRGDFITLRGWLDALPEPFIIMRPWLCLARARLAVLAHELEVGERWLGYVDQAVLPRDQQQRLYCEALTIRMQIALYSNELPSVIELSEQALAIVPDDHLQMRAEILQYTGGAFLWTGQLNTALAAFGEANQLSEAAGDTYLALLSASNYGATLVTLAQLRAAERHFYSKIQQFAHRSEHMPIVASLFLERADIFYEWNELDQATIHIEQGLKHLKQANMPRLVLAARLTQVSIACARGDIVSAQFYIDDAATLVDRYSLPVRYSGQVEAAQVNVWLRTGNMQAAGEWLTTLTFSPLEELTFLQTFELFAWVHVLIAQQAADPTIAILEQMQQRAAAAQQQQFVIRALVLQAVALSVTQPESDAALATLERALVLAEPESFVRSFVDEGAPMAVLLRAAHQRGIAPTYTARLLAAFPE